TISFVLLRLRAFFAFFNSLVSIRASAYMLLNPIPLNPPSFCFHFYGSKNPPNRREITSINGFGSHYVVPNWPPTVLPPCYLFLTLAHWLTPSRIASKTPWQSAKRRPRDARY